MNKSGRGLNTYAQTTSCMTEDSSGQEQPADKNDSRDEIIRKRSFSRARGIDVSSFMVDEKDNQEDLWAKAVEEVEEEKDIAMGEIAEIFSKGGEDFDRAGAIQKDGTVKSAPEMDSVTDLAVYGEKRLGFGLLIAMIFSWSLIGTIVGTVLDPIFGAIGLSVMAIVGLYLGEKWIPNPNMRILGVTWVIISMKLIYGLVLDLWHWGWLDDFSFADEDNLLGALLLLGVVLNIGIAQRHDEDAIAAQAILILLVVGSAAGALYGEFGVAVMIGIGTIMLHGLAIIRNSGNLASMGIAVSYLWVGVHAISNNWDFFGLEILPFEDELLLFLLMVCVTATNSTMAAKFVEKDNWFSDAFKSLGLGKPGLWSVSVGLGMIGALLAVAANRLETGYALAQLVLLLTAFSASYLVVRGVEWSRLLPLIILPAPILLFALAILESGIADIDLPYGLRPYSFYAAITAAFTAGALLRNQTAVSDHVLWAGGLVIVVLLTLLIPANDEGSGARTLLISQGIVWVGLAQLSMYRDSPSIAGTAVVGPWLWLLFFATDAENRLVSADYVPILIEQYDLAAWMLILLSQQIWVNIKHGETGFNLASRLSGMSELGARIRDSEILQLWNLSFLLALFVTWSITRPGSLPAIGLFGVLTLLMISHAIMVLLGKHKGKPRTLMTVWGVSAIALSWTYGQQGVWAITLVITSAILLISADRKKNSGMSEELLKKAEAMPGQLLTLMMGLLSGLFIIIALEPLNLMQLDGGSILPDEILNLYILTAITLVALVLYLRRAATVEKLLPPAIAAVGLLAVMAITAQIKDSAIVLLTTILTFIGAGAYLAIQGEFRSEIRSVAKKEERLLRIEEKQARLQKFVEAQAEEMDDSNAILKEEDNKTKLKMIDIEMLDLVEKQRKRAKRAGTTGEYDLEIGDIHHKPVIVMAFLVTTILASAYLSFTSSLSYLVLAFCVVISILFIALARIRANDIGLRLPDVAGIELPIAISMAGLVLVHLAGRISDSVVGLDDAKHLAVITAGLCVLAGIGLIGRNDLGLRIPNAVEGVVYLLAVDRVLALIIGGEVPVMYRVDPFDGGLIDWTLPILFVEVVLLACVLAYDWVEKQRLMRGLADHRGAVGRAAWVIFAGLISIGVAGILAIIFVLRRGWNWTQPAAVMVAWLIIPIALSGLMYWSLEPIGIEPIGIHILSTIVGGLSILFVIWSIVTDSGAWLAAGLWSVHLLLIPSGFGWGALVFVAVLLTVCSATSWVSGILVMRKSWRVFGALDMVLAWIVAMVMFSTGAGIETMLAILIASSILLGIVTYLNQTYEKEIING